MGITLAKLFNKTKDKFHMEILAGKKYTSNEVTRLYYMEDTLISNWTRQGELIITTAMNAANNSSWLIELIESILPFEPSGLIVNIGGYIDSIPQSVIDYCNTRNLPLIIFPWQTFLQDVMQDWTNRIFQAEQMQSNAINAFLNIILNPDDSIEYMNCLVRNGYATRQSFQIAIINFQDKINKNTLFISGNGIQRAKNFSNIFSSQLDDLLFIPYDKQLICISFNEQQEKFIDSSINIIDKWEANYTNEKVYIGVGPCVHNIEQLNSSYLKAKFCLKFAQKDQTSLKSFDSLGIVSILYSADHLLLQQFVDQKLSKLKQIDNTTQTEYIKTLRLYVENGGNAVEVARQLYLHRNTVNYRLKKIQEITHEHLESPDVKTNYKIAFLSEDILNILD